LGQSDWALTPKAAAIMATAAKADFMKRDIRRFPLGLDRVTGRAFESEWSQ
jgi:hypothetical protein